MTMHSVTLKNLGYLLCLLPPVLVVAGVAVGVPWLSVVFFFGVLPIVRYLIGDDASAGAKTPTKWLEAYFATIPRLYFLAWAALLPWSIWVLVKMPMSGWQHVGFAFSLWIVCSLNTAVAHELIHSAGRFDRMMGGLLDATVGYFHFAEEHLSHHAKTGHYHGGDAARPGTSIYRYALHRYLNSLQVAWRYEVGRLRRQHLAWYRNRLLRKAPVPMLIGFAFYWSAGLLGLGIYAALIVGTAFSVQAITYLQHWGLSELETPEQADFGFSWEDCCWMQACVTLNHAYHGQHHLAVRKPYFLLAPNSQALTLPASYPVMFVVALFPAAFDTTMRRYLDRWRSTYAAREEQRQRDKCGGVAVLLRAAKDPALNR
jgi:alkane 1-monooxygenase